MDAWRKLEVKGIRRQSGRLSLTAFLLVCLILSACILSVKQVAVYSTLYAQDMNLAGSGMQHLQKAQSLLRVVQKNPLDVASVGLAHQEFAQGSKDLSQLYGSLKSLPAYTTAIPVYGKRLSAALRLVPLAITLAQTGEISCTLFQTLMTTLHSPLSAQGPLLTKADLESIAANLQSVRIGLDTAATELRALKPSDIEVEPRIGTMVSKLHTELPDLQRIASGVEGLLTVAPALLGLSTPANYLVEILDSTELRPGGGFIGNYGIATLSQGRLASVHVMDSYLLDRPFYESNRRIDFPAAYAWFPITQFGWSFRDSNLDADFPTAAKYALQNYTLEGGTGNFQGVFAITPAFIQSLLTVTGPIGIPEYGEVVTTHNLIDLIHYYQLEKATVGTGNSSVLAPDGNSSQRKHFVALLGERLVERIHQLSSAELPKVFQLIVHSLATKDIQLYLDAPMAEQLLTQNHLDGAIQSSTDDNLMVVDANVSGSKANELLGNKLDDSIVLNARGSATHTTTLTYTWSTDGKLYGTTTYKGYIRVYAPTGSALVAQSGWQFQGGSVAFGHQVWAGMLSFPYNPGGSTTITLTWTVPSVAKHDGSGWHYGSLIQRQAGAHLLLHTMITLPSCASHITTKAPLMHNSGRTEFAQVLNQDITIGVDYNCK